jgi:uncharacterized protein YgbK (DUF1537 family)
MMRVLVIADDLTGAAEIGGIAHRYGLDTRLLRFPIRGSEAAAATVIDTDSRQLANDEAGRRVKDAVAAVELGQFDLIYKKTDSVLRGPVRAELEGLMEVLGLGAALLVPQNPSRGRTIRQGQYFIEDVPLNLTEFGEDPIHPARTSDVLQLLGNAKRPAIGSGIRIGNGSCWQDLKLLAKQVDARTLAAGGADFFAAMIEERGMRRAGDVAPLPETRDGRMLFVCGSASGSRRLIERASDASMHICAMPDELFRVGCQDRGAVEAWSRSIIAALEHDGRAVVVIPQAIDPQGGASARLESAVAEVVAEVLSHVAVARLFLEGGATGSAICRRMGWSEFQVAGELSSGIVQLRVGRTSLQVVVKPGSYPWPDHVFD